MKKSKVTKGIFKRIGVIVDRAIDEDLGYSDKLTMLMDIEAVAHMIDLDKLLKFDRFNFARDIVGICNNINRRTGKLDNCFLPRCSR